MGNNYPLVLHISTAKTWRGGEQQLAYLYEELNLKGVQQVLLCARSSVLEQYCISRSYNYISIRKGSNLNLLFTRQVRNICNKKEIDIIHAHDSHALTFAILAATLFGNETPIIVSRRVDFPIRSKRKYNHKNITKIICVSDAIREITGSDIVNKSVLTTIHSGIDLNRFSTGGEFKRLRTEFNIPPGTPLVGNVAALAPHKDYTTFLDTAGLLVEKGIPARYFIIGEGRLEEQLKDYADDKGLNEHVIFTGFRNDIPEILPELDIFLVTSETEGLSTSILDAIACKVPVVATNAGGITEIIEHNVTGMLGEIKQPETLVDGILTIFSNETLREEIVTNATEKLKEFTKETTAEKTLQIYLDAFEITVLGGSEACP
ncbi:MAG: glycosyltransferase family 4 protein [Candidatus Latescibacteria bacterium]|nr:glycosyltransferase family 4 protein [Candidatus Latescibacterota bacterium]